MYAVYNLAEMIELGDPGVYGGDGVNLANLQK
jgi:hypothetical protein